ncbi:MAG: KH domain-containing protein [Candidatus Subteraquimicrobiales bacterium]|nr:KH domain-containing protein [Candidatus Subteraquimicrobiales bacterium]
MLKELLETLAQALVDNPGEVSVTMVEGEKSVILQLKVASDDVGKVIGKEGRIAKALRIIVGAAAAKESKRAMVEIID